MIEIICLGRKYYLKFLGQKEPEMRFLEFIEKSGLRTFRIFLNKVTTVRRLKIDLDIKDFLGGKLCFEVF